MWNCSESESDAIEFESDAIEMTRVVRTAGVITSVSEDTYGA